MKTIEEIRDQIATLKCAIVKAEYVPVPLTVVDGKKLEEHLYYRRTGAIDYLEWVIKTKEQEEEEEVAAEARLNQMNY